MSSTDWQTIHFFGVEIRDTMAMLTDLLISAVAFYAWYQLRKKQAHANRQRLYFQAHFLLMSLATFLGGVVGHGFSAYLGFAWKLPGWLLSMLSVTLLERAVIEQAGTILHKKFVRYLLVFNIMELLVFAALAFGTLNFKFVEYHSAYGLLVVILGVGIAQKINQPQAPLRYLFTGVLFGVLAACVFKLQISLHPWFNYVDFSHVFLALSVFSFYRQATHQASV